MPPRFARRESSQKRFTQISDITLSQHIFVELICFASLVRFAVASFHMAYPPVGFLKASDGRRKLSRERAAL